MADIRAGKVIGVDAAVARIEAQTKQKVVQFADAVGIDVIAYLRSLTSELRPPVGARSSSPMSRRTTSPGRLSRIVQRRLPGRSSLGKGGPRRAHPGHWADITGQLAASYSSSAQASPNGATITFANSASYAEYLERHDGYFVLSGIADNGGPVDRSIAKLAQQFGFTLTRVS